MVDLNSSGWKQQDQRSLGARKRDSMKEDRWHTKTMDQQANYKVRKWQRDELVSYAALWWTSSKAVVMSQTGVCVQYLLRRAEWIAESEVGYRC